MMDEQDTIVVKPKPQKDFLIAIVAFILVPFLIYYLYVSSDNDWIVVLVMWIVLALGLMRHLSALLRGENPLDNLTLRLAPQGFYKGDTLHKWNDIDYFGIKKRVSFLIRVNTQVVYWKYKSSSSSRTFSHNLLRILSGYDDVLLARYEIEPDALAKLLNDWKIRYTGQPSEIEHGRGFNRNLTKKEIKILIALGLVLFFAVIGWSLYLMFSGD